MKRKALAWILILCMLFCNMPMTVFATSAAAETDNTSYVAEIDGTEYETLQGAIDDAENGDIITIIDDINVNAQNVTNLKTGGATFFKVDDESITIDLNGKKISADVTTGLNSTLNGVFATENTGCLVLKDSVGTGTVDLKTGNPDITENTVKAFIMNCGENSQLTIKGGNYTVDYLGNGTGMLYTKIDETFTVEGGNFYLANLGTKENGSPWILNTSGKNTGKSIVVTGGTFNADINHQYWCFEVDVPKEKALKNNGGGTWTVVDANYYVDEWTKTDKYYKREVGYVSYLEALTAAEGKLASAKIATENSELEAQDIIHGLIAVASIEGEMYSSLQEAIKAAENGDTVKVIADHEIASETARQEPNFGYDTLVYVSGKEVTIDFNGNTVTATPENSNGSLFETVVFVDNGGKLTLKDSSTAGNGGITVNEATNVYSMIYNCGATVEIENGAYIFAKAHKAGSLIYAEDEHSTVVKGGTLTLGNAGEDTDTTKPWIFNTEGKNDTFIYLSGGTFNQDIFMNVNTRKDCETRFVEGYGIGNNGNGTWTVGEAAALVDWSYDDASIIDMYYTTLDDAVAEAGVNDTVRMLKNTTTESINIEADNPFDLNGYTLTITGSAAIAGTVTGEGEIVLGSADAKLTAAEGLNVTTNVADSKVVYQDGAYKVIVKEYLAQVGEVKYESLKDALEACTNGETVKLIADITYDTDDIVNAIGGATGFGDYPNPSIIDIGGERVDGVNTPSNVNAVLDLNGHTITNNADAFLFMIMDNAKVKFTDSVGTGKVVGNADAPVIWAIGTETLVTIEDGTYTTSNATGLLHCTHGGDLVINGGEFSTSAEDASLLIVRNSHDRQNSKYFISGKATVTVNEGKFHGFNPEKTMDDSTNPFTEFNAVSEECKAIENNGVWEVFNYVKWIKAELLAGNDVTLEKDIVVYGSMIESIPAPTNNNGEYPNYGIFNVVGDVDVTFDLNGHDITYNGHKSFVWNNKTVNSCTVAHGLFFVNDGADFTFVDSAEEDGTVKVYGLASGVYSVSPNTVATIQGGNWINEGCVECDGTNIFIYAQQGGEIYIEDGYFNQDLDANGDSYLLVEHGGSVKNDVIDYSKSKLEVSGGTFVGMSPDEIVYINQAGWNTQKFETIEATAEGFVTVDNGDGTYTVKPEIIVAFDDIIMALGNDLPEFTYTTNFTEVSEDGEMLVVGEPEVTVNGLGEYEITAEAYVFNSDKYVVKVVPGKLTVVEAVAEIDGVGYGSLQAAIDAAQDGDAVKMLKDINIANEEIDTLAGKYNTYYRVAGKTVTIDLNGKTISGEYTGDSMLVGVFSTEKNGHLTLTGNGTVDVTTAEGSTVYGLLVNYEAGSSIVVKNGTYKLDKASDSLIYTGGTEDVIIEDGTFTLGNVGTGKNKSPWIFNAKGQNTAHVMVYGGTYNAEINHQYYPFEVEIPVNKALKKNDNNTWTIVDAVAYVDEQEWSSKWYTHEVGYATLEEALDAAESQEQEAGKVVHLIKAEFAENTVVVPADVTLDLNGKTLNAGYVASFGDIIDETSGGMIVVPSARNVYVIEGNGAGKTTDNDKYQGYLPIFDTDKSAYKFFEYQLAHAGGKTVSEDAVKFGFRLYFSPVARVEAYSLLAQGNTGVNLSTDITWGEKLVTISYNFKPEKIADYGTTAKNQLVVKNKEEITAAFTLTVNGLKSLKNTTNIYATPILSTDAGTSALVNGDSTRIDETGASVPNWYEYVVKSEETVE